MRKAIATLMTAVVLAAPVAQAEGTPITVEFQYDSTKLATEVGAKSVLKSIKAQAKKACTYAAPVTGSIRLDRSCRDDLVDQAIGKIRLAAVAEGEKAVYVFASLETEADTSNQ